MIEKEKLKGLIEEYICSLNLNKVKDKKLRYSDGYFIDREEKKYLIYMSVFSEKDELLKNWKLHQGEDIAFYLQKEKFPKKDIRWDCYYLLIYSGEELDEEIVSSIERDLFCSKKIIIHLNDDKELKKILNEKLPLTNGYYLKAKTNAISDEDFFDNLRKRVGIGEDKLTNDILFNIKENKECIENIFSDFEVEIDERD